MKFDYTKLRSHKLYDVARPLARALSHVVYDISCKGKENVPDGKSSGFIIASNHIAFSDPALIVAFCNRRVHFMAKSELFENSLIGFFMKNLNAFPVRRNHSDKAAIRYAQKIINEGGILGIFPEGRRVKEKLPSTAKDGVAFLARITGADVLPVCIYRNPEDKRKRHGLKIIFGEMIKNEDLGFLGQDKKAELISASEKIMSAIRRLWEEENCR